MSVNIEGNTHIYLTLEEKTTIFDIDLTKNELIRIINYGIGDKIKLSYLEGEDPVTVTEIK